MAIDPRRRQRQLARKAAKRKAELSKKHKRQETQGSAWSVLQRALRLGAPIDQVLITSNILEIGFGNVIISRRFAGNLIVGGFQLDTYCLGVKDAMLRILSPAQLKELLDRMSGAQAFEDRDAAYALKLIEGAVKYAGILGLAPHPDYQEARAIFGEVDATACTLEFAYGKEGKPLFVAGPHDSPARCRRILDLLRDRCGPDGFHYIMPIGDAEVPLQDVDSESDD